MRSRRRSLRHDRWPSRKQSRHCFLDGIWMSIEMAQISYRRLLADLDRREQGVSVWQSPQASIRTST
jgi:hypothetical protein